MRGKFVDEDVSALNQPASHENFSNQDDQKRTVSAEQALRDGADYLVVGRPIRDANDPKAAAEQIQEEICRTVTR